MVGEGQVRGEGQGEEEGTEGHAAPEASSDGRPAQPAPSGSLIIRLDGMPSAEHDGVAVSFPTRHAEAALRMIVAAGPQGIPAAEVASLLWPDADARRIGPRFRTVLWQARRSLGPHGRRILRDRDLVRFDIDGVTIEGRFDRRAIETDFGADRV